MLGQQFIPVLLVCQNFLHAPGPLVGLFIFDAEMYYLFKFAKDSSDCKCLLSCHSFVFILLVLSSYTSFLSLLICVEIIMQSTHRHVMPFAGCDHNSLLCMQRQRLQYCDFLSICILFVLSVIHKGNSVCSHLLKQNKIGL